MNNNDYKLSNTQIPELYQIKSAHQELMLAYAESLAAVTRLSFFVGLNEVRLPKDSAIKRFLFKIVWAKYSPFRIFAWRPMVALFVDAHLHQKLRELLTGYIQFKYLVLAHYLNKKELISWLDEAQGECRQLLETFTSGKIFLDVVKNTFSFLIGVFSFAWGVNGLVALTTSIVLLKPPTQGAELIGKLIVFLISAIPILMLFVDSTFATKRAIFLNISTSSENTTIYELENKLFKILNRGKVKEIPIDFLVSTFYYLIFALAIWLFGILLQITIQVQSSNNITYINYFWCLLVPVIVSYISDVILPWIKRHQEAEL